MAGNLSSIREYWTKNERKIQTSRLPQFHNNCIFQDVWRELCRMECLQESTSTCNYHQMRLQHISYLARLLLDCLLTHRFDSALWIMVGLCGSCTRRIPELLWKAGSEVMLNIPDSHSHLVQFYQSMFVVCSQLRPQVLLNFSLYLISHKKELTEGHELLNAKSGQRPFNNDPLIRAYLGLFEYVLWKKNRLRLQAQERHEEGDNWDGTVGQSMDATHRQAKFHGNRALLFFDRLVEQCGVWDIFITKQTELLQYYDRKDEARKVLERYKEKNIDNPNAHRYLYNFMKAEGAEKEKLCQLLEPLLLLDPSTELTQEYAILKQQLGAPVGEVLCMLFNKLDHSACQGSLADWEALAHHLQDLSPDYVKFKLREHWDERSDWWPCYHFRTDMVPLKTRVSSSVWSVALHKAEVADILLGKDNPFSKAVKQQDKSTAEAKKPDDYHGESFSEATQSPAKASPRKRAGPRTLFVSSEVRNKRKKV